MRLPRLPGKPTKVGVVMPCHRVRQHVLDVLSQIGSGVHAIYVVDDCCPDASGKWVQERCGDPRVTVLRHCENQGVGGAVMTGYQAALADGMDVVVKVDGDGQMDPRLIPSFIAPIIVGEADYTKGNRFYDLEAVRAMPKVRLLGNAVLFFMSKLSSGYWDLFDPANGYTAIHADVARRLPFAKLSRGYFFETDMLFRLNMLRAVVVDVPMQAKYGDEVSGLKIASIVGPFLFKHLRNLGKRIFYNYYLRDLSLASIELPLGLLMLTFGAGFGALAWSESVQSDLPSPPGTVMLAALPILVGIQLILAFVGFDIASVPRRPLHRQFTTEPPTDGSKRAE